MSFGENQRLKPNELYGSIIGWLESNERFQRKDIIGDNFHIEYGRIYYDTIAKRDIVIHFPGRDNNKAVKKNDESTNTPSLSTIKKEVDTKISNLKDKPVNPIYFYPIAESNWWRQHFIFSWKDDKNKVIEDSMASSSRLYPLFYLKSKIIGFFTKTIFRGWQKSGWPWQKDKDNWTCGYRTYHRIQQQILGEEATDLKDKINDVSKEMETNFGKYTPNNYVPEIKKEEEVIPFEDDEFDKMLENKPSDEKDEKKQNPNDKNHKGNKIDKKTVLAEIDTKIIPFLKQSKTSSKQLRVLKGFIEDKTITSFKEALAGWKEEKQKISVGFFSRKKMYVKNENLMTMHNSLFFKENRDATKRTAMREFIESLENKYNDTTFDNK